MPRWLPRDPQKRSHSQALTTRPTFSSPKQPPLPPHACTCCCFSLGVASIFSTSHQPWARIYPCWAALPCRCWERWTTRWEQSLGRLIISMQWGAVCQAHWYMFREAFPLFGLGFLQLPCASMSTTPRAHCFQPLSHYSEINCLLLKAVAHPWGPWPGRNLSL